MVKQAGDAVYSDSTTIPAPFDFAANIDYGAAVAYDGTNLVEADGDAHSALMGIKARGGYSNERGVLGTDGVFVAKVESGTAAGVEVDMGDTTAPSTVGVLEASPGGPGVTLCAEGGTYEGYDLAAGLAVVRLR